MSSNLVKQRYMVIPEEESKRVIDNNERMRRRLAIIQDTLTKGQGGGFVSGIAAETVEMLLDEGNTEGNVIKAGEDTGALLEQARGDAEKLLSDAQEEASRIIATAKAQAESEKNKIFEQARTQGYSDGMAKAGAKERALEQEHNHCMEELESFYTQQLEELEPRFVDIITDVYEHIFGVDLSIHKDLLLHLIGTTIRKAEGGRNFLVHVSKEDYPFVYEQKSQLVSNLGDSWKVEVIEDVLLGEGQCMIETESGIFDCGLGTQLEELKKKLMLLAWSKEE